MPRSAEANRLVRERQRANLLDAARRLIASGGPVTMESLAKEAGVSQGLAYRYFRSKEALFRAMMEASLRSSGTMMSRLNELPGSPRDQLEQLVTKVLERRRQNPEFYQFFFRAMSERRFRSRPGNAMHQRFRDFESGMRRLVVAAQRGGEMPPDDPDELVLTVIGCLQGIWRGMSRDREDGTVPPIPRAEIVLRLLGPRGATSAPPSPGRTPLRA
jgi:AcrR family transcriptional regulator